MGGFFKVAGCASDFPRKVGFSNHGKRHLVWGYVARESKNFGLCGFVGVFSVQDGIGGMVSPSPRDGKREHKRSFGVYCSFS